MTTENIEQFEMPTEAVVMTPYDIFVEIYRAALAKKPSGEYATFMYTMRSHLRKRLHMRWWKKYHGDKVAGADNISGTKIDSLDDQHKWLSMMLKEQRAYADGYNKWKSEQTDPSKKYWWRMPMFSEDDMFIFNELIGAMK